MKKISIFITSFLCSATLFSQVPNGSFENIRIETEVKPAYWISSGKAEQTTDMNGGNFAIKQYGGKATFTKGVNLSIAANAFTDGVPYQGKPTHLEFYLKGSFIAGDSLLVFSNLSGSGQQYGFVSIDITTLSNNYFKITTPVTITDSSLTCDTINLQFSFIGSDSSYFMVDDIKYSRNGIEEGQLANGDFETWITTQNRILEGWNSTNDFARNAGFPIFAVKDTNDAYDGSHAIFMQNQSFFGQAIPGVIITGVNNLAQQPAFPVSSRFRFLSGYYKYKPTGKDSFAVDISMFYKGTEIGRGSFRSNATKTQYTKFELTIEYDSIFSFSPDSANITISAGPLQDPIAGSKAWVDKISFENIGIDELISPVSSIEIFPNPAVGDFNIMLHHAIEKQITVQLFDLNGKEIKNIYQGQPATNTLNIPVNTNSISDGCYILSVKKGEQVFYKKLVIYHE